MATTAIAGYNGTVTAVGTEQGSEVSEWSATITTELMDATSFDSAGYREFVEGLKSCTGSFHAKGLTAPANGSASSLVLEAGAAGSLSISGAAIINEVNPGVPHDGLVEFDASFSYTGSYTLGVVGA